MNLVKNDVDTLHKEIKYLVGLVENDVDTLHEEKIHLVGFSFIKVIDYNNLSHPAKKKEKRFPGGAFWYSHGPARTRSGRCPIALRFTFLLARPRPAQPVRSSHRLDPVSRRSAEDPVRDPRGLRPRAPLSRSGAHVSGVWSRARPHPIPLPHTLFPPPNEPAPRPAPPAGRKTARGLTRGPGPACHWPRQQGKAPGRARLFPCPPFPFSVLPPRRGAS